MIAMNQQCMSVFDIINPIYSMVLLLGQGGVNSSFCEAVIAIMVEKADWQRGLEPDTAVQADHRQLLRMYMPQGILRADWAEILQACDFWNLPWDGPPGHRCIISENGQPCCQTPAAFKANARKHTHALLLKALPSRQCLSRWLKSQEGVGFFGLGLRAYNVFRHAWEQVATGRLIAEGADALNLGDAADDDEVANEDPHSRGKKRFRKSLRAPL